MEGNTFGKWLGGIIATVIAGVLTYVIIESVRSDNVGTPDQKIKDSLTIPHAPKIQNTWNFPLYDEQIIQFSLEPGEKQKFRGKELWSAPMCSNPSCASGFLALTWQVREPYPYNRDDLEIHRTIPMGGGRTELYAKGSVGSKSFGYCSAFYFFNTSMVNMAVEIRFVSGISK